MPTEQPDGNITGFEGFQEYPTCMLQSYPSQPGGPQGAGGDLLTKTHDFIRNN